MSIRDAYENLLIELNKVQAPPLLLKDFVYMFNKGVQQYINLRYNLFETKQQLTDDLRILTRSVQIPVQPESGSPLTISADGSLSLNTASPSSIFGGSYTCQLPADYLHILNCVCRFSSKSDDCFSNEATEYLDQTGGRVLSGNREFYRSASKITTNQWGEIMNNYYMRPSVERPYYYIINIKDQLDSVTDTDGLREQGRFERFAQNQATRYGNSYQPTMQIKCGKDPNYTLHSVFIDYLRAPQYLVLDPTQLDTVQDTSQIIEFPDYVVYEIINDIVKLILENQSNPRIQTHTAVNTTIPQQLEQPQNTRY